MAEEVDREDPLLITTVRARLKRESKAKVVGKKTVKRSVRTIRVDGEEETIKAASEELQPTIPRRYQEEAFQAALKRNIIFYLETGGGKTLVASMLIRALAKTIRLNKRLIVFLAPTVLLVQQQFRRVNCLADMKVGEYYGAKNVDSWSSSEWETQVAEFQVMVMTPQVLLNNLQHGFMKMDMIELLIFDECHHASKNHAYAKIMKGFFHINAENGRLPKIFGMTASPVTKKGVQTCSEAAGQLYGLENLLHAQVFTFKDREEVENVVPTATTIKEYYDPTDPTIFQHYKDSIDALFAKYEKANSDAVGSLKVEFKDQKELMEKIDDKTQKYKRDFHFCLDELGLVCAYKAAEHSFKNDSKVNDFEGFGDAAKACKQNKDLFLRECLQLLKSAVPEGWAAVRTAHELKDAVSKGYLTPKAHQLITALFQKKSTYSFCVDRSEAKEKKPKCIIFVERRMAAVVIASLVNELECLSEFLKAGWICGSNAGVDTTRGQQQSTVTAFNHGTVNLLVATDVAEEGIDVQECSEVIRFSLPKTLRSNIQSRGRARQQGSIYLVFLERGNEAQKEQFLKISKSEPMMREEVITRKHMESHPNTIVHVPIEAYRVASTGASVSPATSVNLIHQFCNKLPSDKFYQPRPEFEPRAEDGMHRYILKLPTASPIQEVVGLPQLSPNLAKQMAAFEACKQLHQIGALNDNLVPSWEFALDEEEEKFIKEKKTSSVGTTMQKELYPSEDAKALSGDWLTKTEDVVLYAYCMSFELSPQENETYSNFVLLTGAPLADDVGTLQTELCLTRGRIVTATLSPLGPTTVLADQLSNAKTFQSVLFNGMFSKMSKGAKEFKKRRRGSELSSLFIDREDLWDSKNAYLLLPAVSNGVDWETIEKTSNAVKNVDEDSEICPPRKKRSFIGFLTREEPPIELTLAGNRQAVPSELADMAVLTLHTTMIYNVLSVLNDTNAHSDFPFPGENIKSYADFFNSKHELTLQYPDQPLLQLKQNHRPHNLLRTGKKQEVAVELKKRKAQKEEEVVSNGDGVNGNTDPKSASQSASLEMPPELCLPLGFSGALIRSAYWVPSVMYRIKAAVLASELRQSIDAPTIPVMEVLKSLTTTRCNEEFNMEALELFGDSFLKYAVSRKLFLGLKTANEGVLSTKRQQRICNRALHKAAVKKGIPVYIRDCPFDPSRWAAPGMLVSRQVPCRCKEEQMFQAFKTTTSTVLGMFKNETLTDKVRTETIKPRIGLTCDKGHRYLCSKTPADVMEALIGAYLENGTNPEAALKFMIWAGIDVDFDPSLMEAASEESLVDLSSNYGMDIELLEARIGYTFKNKYLLLEAMTHPSNLSGDRVRCYQRFEFLGDAVLDILLTTHLFTSHPNSTPGSLTSMRSASVNNERFARVAVKNKFHSYLRHGSGLLLHQIEDFATSMAAAADDHQHNSYGLHGLEAPKVLGDLVESIAGAIAVDTRFDLRKVWAVMKPLLEPIVTPETLDMHPVTELEEHCLREKYHLLCDDQNSKDNQTSTIRYEVRFTDELCIDGISSRPKKKIAKKDAAAKLLAKLKAPGYKEKYGKPIPKPEQNVEAVTKPAMAEALPELPATKSEDNESGDTTQMETCKEEVKVEPSLANPPHVVKNSLAKAAEVATMDEAMTECTNTSNMIMSTAVVLASCTRTENYLEPVSVSSNGISAQAASVKVTQVSFNTGNQTPTTPATAASCVQFRVNEVTIRNSPSSVAAPSKRKSISGDDSISAKLSKHFWSQEMATVQTTSTETHSKMSTDLKLNFCPWTDHIPSGAFVSSTSTTTKASGVFPAKKPSLSNPVTKSNNNSNSSPEVPINCRQILNEIRMKNKWPSPIFKLMNDVGTPRAPRFKFSLIVDTGKEKYECQGESKTDKRQGMESVASIMLTILKQGGIVGLP